MLPETCDPTCTVITALIVPVASTTSSISPRSTFAVKCCACAFRFIPNAANNPATTTTPAKISHRPLIFIYRPWNQNFEEFLFVPQRFNRVEQRSLARRVISKKHAHRHREHRRHNNRLHGHLHRPMQGLSHQVRSENSKQNT